MGLAVGLRVGKGEAVAASTNGPPLGLKVKRESGY